MERGFNGTNFITSNHYCDTANCYYPGIFKIYKSVEFIERFIFIEWLKYIGEWDE